MQFVLNPFTHRLDAYEQDLPTGSDVEFVAGNDAVPVPPNAGHVLTLIGAGGTTVTNTAANTLTIAVAGGGITWTRVAPAAVALAVNNGYVNTNAGLTTFTLPAASALGDLIEIVGEGAGGWAIAQNAGQNIQHDATSTTVGVGGSLSSLNRYDCVRLICRVANTTWAVTSCNGTLNIV